MDDSDWVKRSLSAKQEKDCIAGVVSEVETKLNKDSTITPAEVIKVEFSIELIFKLYQLTGSSKFWIL